MTRFDRSKKHFTYNIIQSTIHTIPSKYGPAFLISEDGGCILWTLLLDGWFKEETPKDLFII